MVADYSAFDAGTAFLTIEGKLDPDLQAKLAAELAGIKSLPVNLTADLKAFTDDLEKQWGRNGYKLPVEFDASGLDKLRAKPLALPTILDTSVAERDVEAFRKWASSDDLTFRASLDMGQARIQLDEFGRQSPELSLLATLDLTHAFEQLEVLRAEAGRGINVPVFLVEEEEGGAGVGRRRRSRHGSDSPDSPDREPAAFKAPAADPRLTNLLGDLKQAKSAFGDVIDKAKELAKITAITGLVGAGGGLVAGLMGMGAVGLLGAHGLKDAFSAQSALTEESRDPLAQMERQDQLRRAATDMRDANEGLQESFWKVNSAQLSARISAMDLTDAYKDQGRAVRDANDALTDAELAQEGSALAVARARQRLLQVDMDPNATGLDRQEAQFGVLESQQRYRESKKKTSDQRVDTAETLQRGVEGSKPVLQAQQAVVDSQHGVTQALWGVQNAEDRVTEAAHEMAKAQLGTSAMDKLNVALAKLSPNARDFFNQIHALAPEFHNLQQAVSTNLFAGLGESLAHLVNDQMPALKSGLTGLASGMNSALKDLFGDLDSMFSKLEADGTMQQFVSSVSQMMTGLAPLITDIAHAFITLAASAGPGIGQLFQSLGQVLVAIAPELGTLGNLLANVLAQALPPLIPGLQAIGQAMIEFVQAVGPTLPGIAKAMSDMLVAVEPLIAPLSQLAATILSAFAANADQLVKSLAPFIVQLAQELAPMIPTVAKALQDMMPTIQDLAGKIGQDLLKAVGDLMLKMPDMITAFSNLFNAAEPLLSPLLSLAGDAMPMLVDIMNPLIGPLTTVMNLFSQILYYVDGLVDGIGNLGNVLSGGALGRLGDFLGLGGSVIGNAVPEGLSGTRSGGPQYHAFGGRVSGPGGPRDDRVPAMLSDGEFVVNADATSKHGPLLEALNSGVGYSLGGHVRREAARLFRRKVLHLSDGGYVVGSDSDYTPPASSSAFGNPGSSPSLGLGSAYTVPATTFNPNLTSPFASALDATAQGGPVNALRWVQANALTPYVWSGTSAQGADCSGWVGDAQQVAMGIPNPTQRLGTTANVLDGSWPGFIAGASPTDIFVIGASSEHMVGRILGVNIEERQSGETSRISNAAASPWDSQFTVVGHIDPKMFVPPYQAGTTGTGWATSGTGANGSTAANSGSGSDSGSGNEASSPFSNAMTDAMANQAVVANTNLPSSWSGLLGSSITKGLMLGLHGGGPQLPFGPEITGTGAQAGTANTQSGNSATPAPPGHSPDIPVNIGNAVVTGNSSLGHGLTQAMASLDSQSREGGLLGAIQTGLVGIAKNSPDPSYGARFLFGSQAGGVGAGAMGAINVGLSGFAKAFGDFVGGEAGSAMKVFGIPDQVPGLAKVGMQVANVFAGQNIPTSGDPSTTQAKKKTTGDAPPPQSTTTPAVAPAVAAAGAAPGGGSAMSGMDAYAATFGAAPSLVAMVKQQASAYGWGSGSEWSALDQLIGHESSWNPLAQNPGSTAHGIFQFLSDTWGTVGGSYTDDPALQTMYGLKYIKNRYGDPLNAWSFWQAQSPHWYAAGGPVEGPGSSIGDTIPAMLSPGEFVVNAKAAQANKALLHAVNNDHRAIGTLVPNQVVPAQAFVGAGAAGGHMDASMTVNLSHSGTDQAITKMHALQQYQNSRAMTYTSRWRGNLGT